MFAFPIWKITLEAPQYTEGISLYIWINKIKGKEPHDIKNINILNHYIGMKAIEPESIPELKIMPYIIIVMSVFALIITFLKKGGLYLSWTVLMIILGILAMVDFYLWEYDYGHNLNPDAPIKIEGMVYQPPLFGRKMLLNFVALSYPQLGAFFMGISILFGALASWFKLKLKN